MIHVQHSELASGKWKTLSFFEQMAHIGSEVERAIKWRKKGKHEYSQMAVVRALELIDLTLAGSKQTSSRLREVARVREVIVDDFYGQNTFRSTDSLWQKYFYPFAYAAAINR